MLRDGSVHAFLSLKILFVGSTHIEKPRKTERPTNEKAASPKACRLFSALPTGNNPSAYLTSLIRSDCALAV
jgi:hypothetical protein